VIDPADAIAFGDLPNDIEMMIWAGWPVAVANADPAVIATEVGAHHGDHTVARVLERWF
jgi:hydroxymethylpyrimidine pyrophosphatase-like HAD family hydrolase